MTGQRAAYPPPSLPRCLIDGEVFSRYSRGAFFCPNGHVLHANSPLGKQHGLDKLSRKERAALTGSDAR